MTSGWTEPEIVQYPKPTYMTSVLARGGPSRYGPHRKARARGTKKICGEEKEGGGTSSFLVKSTDKLREVREEGPVEVEDVHHVAHDA